MKLTDLFEALPLSLAKKFRKLWEPGKYKELFNTFQDKDKNGYRIYFPLAKNTEVTSGKKALASQEIYDYLTNKGYEHWNYLQGLAWKDENGKRKIRISKILSDNPVLLKQFETDPKRANVKKDNLMVVISRHAYDIAAMSTDRGWTSCMDLAKDEGDETNRYVMSDVSGGTIVAYVIESNDRNIKHPISRLLIKPFVKVEIEDDDFEQHIYNEQILYPENKQYGTNVAGFSEFILDWCNKVNDQQSAGAYCLTGQIYQDEIDHRQYNKLDQLSDEQLIQLIKKSSSAFKHLKNPSEAVQLYAVKYSDCFRQIKNPSEKVKMAAIKSSGRNIAYIKNPSKELQLAAVESDARSITYIENPSDQMQVRAVQNWKTAIRYIENPCEAAQLSAVSQDGDLIEYISNPSTEVQLAAVSNYTRSIGHIKNPSEEVQMIAAERLGNRIEHYVSNLSPKVTAYLSQKKPTTTESTINEYSGRIIAGSNTTIDVKPDHIKTMAAKFGFDVDIDGRPPLLTDQTPMLKKLFNKQLTEKRIPKTHIQATPGINNEYLFATAINNYVSSSEKPINVVITDGKSKITIQKVSEVKFHGRYISKGDKADVVIVGSTTVPFSIKQDNANYWGKTERLYGNEGSKIIQNLVKNKKVKLQKIEDYYRLSSEIVYKVPAAMKRNIVFGNDNAIVLKRTFSEQDFSFKNNTLTITVSEILKTVADLKGSNDVYFLIRNDRSRRSKQLLPGITMSAVSPMRALSPHGDANRIIVS